MGTDRELSTETPPRLMFSIWPWMTLVRFLSDAPGVSLQPRNCIALEILREHRLSGLSSSPFRTRFLSAPGRSLISGRGTPCSSSDPSSILLGSRSETTLSDSVNVLQCTEVHVRMKGPDYFTRPLKSKAIVRKSKLSKGIYVPCPHDRRFG